MAEPATWEALTNALRLCEQHQARRRELEAASAGPLALADATRAGILAAERACTIGHALALAEFEFEFEVAQAGSTAQATAEAQTRLHEMQELLREAKELATHIG